MAVLKCPCSTFSNVIFKQMPRSHWFLSINSQYLQPYWLLQQTSEHTKLQRYKDTKIQRYKATKIHTLTPMTYELFLQNSSNKVMRATLYSGIELQLAWSKVSTKVCGFTFGSTSLHLISKRIKEILTQKHHYNAKYLQQLALFASSLVIVCELKGRAFEQYYAVSCQIYSTRFLRN